jgi:hypothetical protein
MVMRRGPGLVGTMATAAVVGGTAAAVSGAVSGNQQAKAQEAAAQQAAQTQANQNQQDIQTMQAQMAAMQAQQVQAAVAAAPAPAAAPTAAAPAAAAPATDVVTQLQQLSQLKAAGALTDAQFEAAKAKLLGMA